MIKSREFINKRVKVIDGIEYVTKNDAILAITMEGEEHKERFNRIFGDGCAAICGFDFDPTGETTLNIKIMTPKP